jgi:hypothetical protein
VAGRPGRSKWRSLVVSIVCNVLGDTYMHNRRSMLTSLLLLVLDEVERLGHMDLVLRTGLALYDEESLHYADKSYGGACKPG